MTTFAEEKRDSQIRKSLEQILPSIKMRQFETELLINATPTSEKRNKLTEANIHLLTAVAALEAAQSL